MKTSMHRISSISMTDNSKSSVAQNEALVRSNARKAHFCPGCDLFHWTSVKWRRQRVWCSWWWSVELIAKKSDTFFRDTMTFSLLQSSSPFPYSIRCDTLTCKMLSMIYGARGSRAETATNCSAFRSPEFGRLRTNFPADISVMQFFFL